MEEKKCRSKGGGGRKRVKEEEELEGEKKERGRREGERDEMSTGVMSRGRKVMNHYR